MAEFYVIESIRCKGCKLGVLRDFHKELLGRKCYVISLEKGTDGWFAFKPLLDDDYGRGEYGFHRIHATQIIECTHDADGSIEFETQNTFYRFRPFGGVHTVDGDIFKSNADVIVHQVNCQGVMGSGVAKQVREKYPNVFEAYQKRCRDTLNPLGHTLCVEAPDGTVIANLFAQNKYGYDGKRYTDYEALGECLKELRAECLGKVVAIPYLMSCARGGGDWDKVSKMIEESLTGCDVTYYRYNG